MTLINHPFDDAATVTAALTPQQKIDDLNAMGRRNIELAPEKAIAAAQQAANLSRTGTFEENPYKEGIAESYIVCGEAYLHQRDAAQALQFAIDAMALAKDESSPALLMRARTLMGVLEMHFDEFASALEYLHKAMRTAEDLGNAIQQAVILNHMGRLYLKTTDMAEALRFFEKGRAISERHMQTQLLAENYRYSCDTCAALGEQDKALEYGQKALDLYREIGMHSGEAAILGSLGVIYTGAGAYSQALTYFERSQTLAKRDGNRTEMAKALKASAEVYLHTGELERALDYLEQALTLARNDDDRALQRDIHQDMSEIYRQQQHYNKALHHFKFFHRLHQDVHNRESSRQITRLNIMHNVEDMERSAARDRQHNDLLQREIARRKKAEEELQARAERLERLERLKTDMLRLAAHDMRTPLGIMMTTLEMVEYSADMPFNEKQQSYLKTIRTMIRDMLKMLEDILSMERIEQMYAEDNHEPFDLYERVSQAILNLHGKSQERHQYLKMSLQATEAIILGDRTQITEAVKNLIDNAIKYTPEKGTIQINLYRDGDFVVFEVEDTGYGIPQDQQPDLFSPFYRAKTRETVEIKGTGLGLHLVKNIIERHGGTIIFKSEYKTGSTFGFRLPLRIVSTGETTEQPAIPAPVAQVASAPVIQNTVVATPEPEETAVPQPVSEDTVIPSPIPVSEDTVIPAPPSASKNTVIAASAPVSEDTVIPAPDAEETRLPLPDPEETTLPKEFPGTDATSNA